MNQLAKAKHALAAGQTARAVAELLKYAEARMEDSGTLPDEDPDFDNLFEMVLEQVSHEPNKGR
jgi:hypothetical protein